MSEHNKPVLLLDVDGVVNAVSKAIPTQAWHRPLWNVGKLFGFELKWATPVVDWLTRLHTEDRAEIRWHTTWQHDALVFGNLVGLPEFAVQDCPEWARFNENGSALAADLIKACQPPWWKYPAAERVVTEEKRPLVWIDDDITWEIPHGARTALGAVSMLCLVSPSMASGVCPKHMRQVDTFLEMFAQVEEAAVVRELRHLQCPRCSTRFVTRRWNQKFCRLECKKSDENARAYLRRKVRDGKVPGA